MDYLVHIAIFVAIYSILAVSLNLVVGFTGLLSVTHAAFMGIGAYLTALLLTHFDMNFFVALLIVMAGTGVISFLVGYVLSKFSGDYFALGSFGFSIITYSIFLNWSSVTNGALGISRIPKPGIFGLHISSNYQFLIFAGIFAVVIFFISQFIVRSSFGRVLKAIREDEKVVQVFGYNTLFFKLAIFVIGAIMASVAGALFATYLTYVGPYTFTLAESIFILSIVILGGLANNKGVVFGTACLIVIPELLRFIGLPSEIAGQMRQLIYGVILVVLMLYRPQGLMGEYKL